MIDHIRVARVKGKALFEEPESENCLQFVCEFLGTGGRQRLQAAWEAAEWEERAAALERRDEARLAAAQAALARRLLAVRARNACCVLRHANHLPCA